MCLPAMMAEPMNHHKDVRESRPRLDTNERVTEVLFGLIMVLTFTGSLSIAESGHTEVRTMLVGALGCNLAWGAIDAILFLMACLHERGRSERLLIALHDSANAQQGCEVVREALPATVRLVLLPAEVESLRVQLLRLPRPDGRPGLNGHDWLRALGIFILVFFSALPVVVPFVFMHDIARALRISNAIAIAMLFVAGWFYGRSTGLRPVLTGLGMVLLGTVLALVTMALGG